jgi:hypothetical protein
VPTFKDSVRITYQDQDNREILDTWDGVFLPRVGENIRIANVPYVVVRIGHDLPKDKIERVWVVLRPT